MNMLSGLSDLEGGALAKVLRRTVVSSIVVGAGAVIVALLLSAPWFALGLAIGLGMAVVHLGGGRHHPNDAIDHAVGLVELAGLGQHVERGQALAQVHARDDDGARAGVAAALEAYRLAPTPPAAQPAIYQRIG